MTDEPLRLGVAGLGRAFMLMLPTLTRDPRIRLVAGADPRPEARQAFAEQFGAASYGSVEALCDDANVQAVYIATPHQHHLHHLTIAAAREKHVLVEKPMAVTIEECSAMIEAARRARVQLIVGHSHSFDAPYLRTRKLIASGAFGRVRMISALNFTDFLYRPRRPEELVTAQGGGVVFGQGAHQVDIARLLGGGRAKSVRAATGAWDRARPTEGAYSALLTFDDGAFASLTYSGYGHFDSDEFCGWIGEVGQERDQNAYGAGRAMLRMAGTVEEEIALKRSRSYGAALRPAASDASAHHHFGLVIASCERADLRALPEGVMVYADDERRLDPLPPPAVPRAEVIDELYGAVAAGRSPLHSGEWGLATLEACLAILRSAREGREIALEHQVAVADLS